MQNIYRHGDILLKRIKTLPQGDEVKTKGQYILAYGEVTGHKHVMTVEKPEHLKVLDNDGGIFIELTEPATVTHEEHNTITVEPGYFEVIHEQHRDPFMGSITRVLD